MAMPKRKHGASMVTVTINGAKHEVSDSTANALFGVVKSESSRVFPVTTKVNAAQKAWLYEAAGNAGITVSALIASFIQKEIQNGN